MTSQVGGTTKHLQKTACVQVGIDTKSSQAHACCQDKQLDGVVQQLGQYQLVGSYVDIIKQGDLIGPFMFETVLDILGHHNKLGLTIFKQFYVASSATKKAWEGAQLLMVVNGTF